MTYTKTICLTLTIQGDYTNKIDLVKRIENIPENTLVTSRYDVVTNTTVCACMYDREVKKFTEE